MITQATPTARTDVSAGGAADANGARRFGLDGSGIRASWSNRVGVTSVVLVAVVFCLGLLFASGADAASYSLGSPLAGTAGKLVSGVAVDQSSHDVYVASCGVEEGLACNGGTGAFKEFSSAGTELACSLEGAPAHPTSVAVDPVTGAIDVFALVGTEEVLGKAEVFVYGANCGAKQHEFPVNGSGGNPVSEPTVDPAGTFLFPAIRSLESCSQSGACSEAVSGGFEYATGVAADASGDLYLASNPSQECAETGTKGKLVKYLPDGKGGYSEMGAFAGLDGSSGHAEVTSVAVDRRTGQVFVGRGCGGSFKIERYRAGGAKIDEFGAGTFSFGSFLVYNELAVDESTGRVYATDSGHEQVQVFGYSGPAFVSLGTSVVGEGTVVCEVGGHEEPCASEYETGTSITVKAVGANFVQWGGATGSAEAPCKSQTLDTCTFTLSAASTVKAEFAFAHPSVLTVFKGANGSGTVKSVAPRAALNCGIGCEEGQATFEEGVTVELEESPQPGSVFAGWLGCRHVSATTCQVTLGSPQVEVTAVFLTEGKEGPAGKEGAAGKEGPAGKEGAAGKTGAAGKEGKQGTTGATGPAGAQGQQGTAGTAGPAGPVGPAGAQGPQGLPGPAGKVTCTVKQAGKKAKVTCTVKYPTQAKSSSTRRSVRWTLVQHGHIVAHGASRRTPKIKLGALRHGTYTLYLQGQHQGTAINVH